MFKEQNEIKRTIFQQTQNFNKEMKFEEVTK